MVVSELRGENRHHPVERRAGAVRGQGAAPAKVREVYVDDENRQATVVVPDGELSLAIGKEGLNARLATRLTGWRIDIVARPSTTRRTPIRSTPAPMAKRTSSRGRCIAVTSSGKRCPNQALDGSRYCGVPAHRELAAEAEA